jgi:hypothetical protein
MFWKQRLKILRSFPLTCRPLSMSFPKKFRNTACFSNQSFARIWKVLNENERKRQSYPCNRPWRPIWLWDVEAPTLSLDNRLTDGGEVVSLTRRPPYIPRKISGTHFCQRLSRPRGHNAAGRVRSVEKSNKIGNRTRGLPTWSNYSSDCEETVFQDMIKRSLIVL